MIENSSRRYAIKQFSIVWLILDAWLSFTEDKSEWNGTTVIFEVSKNGERTNPKNVLVAIWSLAASGSVYLPLSGAL